MKYQKYCWTHLVKASVFQQFWPLNYTNSNYLLADDFFLIASLAQCNNISIHNLYDSIFEF